LRAPPLDPFYISDIDKKTILTAASNNKKGGNKRPEIK